MRKRAARSILAIYLVLVTGLHPAWSAPVITSTVTDLGDGLFAYDLMIDGQDGEYRSYFAQDFTFTGNFARFVRYSDEEEQDVTASYLSDPWAGNTLGAPVQSPGSFKFNAGSGAGSKYLSLPLARVVVAGDLSITGSLARNGGMYLFDGSFSSGSPFSTLDSTLIPDFVVAPPPVDQDPEVVPPLTPEVPATPEIPTDVPLTPTIVIPPVLDPVTPVTEIPANDPPAVPEIPPAFPEGDNGIRAMPILDNPINFPVFIWQPDLLIPAPTTIETDIFFDPFYRNDLLSLDLTLQPIVMFGGAVTRDMSFATTNAGITPNLAVPEPSTWSLAAAALATLALLGLSGRRRSTAA